jgi:putative chitinase
VIQKLVVVAEREPPFCDQRLLATPELLEHPIYASLSAAWFWQRAGLNSLADLQAL